MEKFSLYDLLGLLLPGVLFVYFCNVLNSLYHVFPFLFTSDVWDISIGILLCFALITGAMLYALNFWLINNWKWFNWLFGMNHPVGDLYLEMISLHKLMNGTLNRKAIEWYGKDIYYSDADFKCLTKTEQKQAKEFQDEYYDRMYYELEYENKIENPKTFQSFYFFFRQLVTACLLLLLLIGILQVVILIPSSGLIQPKASDSIWFAICLLISLILSAILARWYRKRMVMKMYWAYFTLLNQTLNK